MINLSHWTRWPIPVILPYKWLFYVVLCIFSVTMGTLMERAIRSILFPKSASEPFGSQL